MTFNKRVLIVCLPALLILVPGCSQDTTINQLEKQNIALIRRVHAEISVGNLDIMQEVLAENYVRHCQAMPPGFQEIEDTALFMGFLRDFLTAVPDCKDEIDFIIADSNMVAYVTTTSGTQTGPMGDLPASGKQFRLKNIVIQRIESGKIAETWISWDNVALLSQLGFFPAPEPDRP
jgi:predicted ester cyclase